MPAILPGDSAAANDLARAFALALNDGVVREQLLEDLRDSPFPKHKIHLQSYLRGPRGTSLAARIAEAAETTVERILLASATRGGLQLSMPSTVDRMFWEGTPDIAVKGTPLTLSERAALFRATGSVQRAYTLTGTANPHGLLTQSAYPVLEISPIDVSFGSKPEQIRAAATSSTRRTVSTFEDEIESYRRNGDSSSAVAVNGNPSSFVEECDPETTIMDCPGGGGGGGGGVVVTPPRPMGVRLPSGKNFDQCYRPGQFLSSVDGDRDGIDDQCEAELAKEFSPQLVFMFLDCDPRRAPYFAARYANTSAFGGVIVIFYALSYVYDCGPPFTCPNSDPMGWCDTHRGDSEFLILEVGRYSDPARPWALKYATLSAHWGASGDNTAGYAAQNLEDAIGSPGFGAPRIWVSKGKHANYRSQIVCNSSGFWNTDDCGQPNGLFTEVFADTDTTALRNLGNRSFPFRGGLHNPVPDRGSLGATPTPPNGHVEWFWENPTTLGFCGWSYYQSGPCSTRYSKSLEAYRFW
ncbi:MAG TPA: hypothetical protein VNO75_06640 [Gemmatimonadaceae bacterium]|nr:hypothetical protein [Gemmatimonadaceae bacterium]